MQVRFIGGNMAVPDPPLRKVRVRSIGWDKSGTEPKPIFVYSDGKTQSERDARWIDVLWDDGGLSRIPNDEDVTWLNE